VTGNRGIVDLGYGATAGGAFMVTPEHGARVMGGNRFWSPAPPTTSPSIGVVTLTGGTTNGLSAWINGVQQQVTATGSVAINTSGAGTLGAWALSPVGSNNFDGDLAELLVYDRALSLSERQSVQDHLAVKYAISGS
jgi:hypothetical protein